MQLPLHLLGTTYVSARADDVLRIATIGRLAVRRAGLVGHRDITQTREILAAASRTIGHVGLVPVRAAGQTSTRVLGAGGPRVTVLERARMSVSEYPGFVSLAPELQGLLLRVEGGDEDVRPALLERVADALNVFIGLELLQFVFVPESQSEGTEGAEIDLIAPHEEEPAVAWFSVDEAGYDEFRDAVTLFGDLADILNPPIVLDVDDALPGAPGGNGAP